MSAATAIILWCSACDHVWFQGPTPNPTDPLRCPRCGTFVRALDDASRPELAPDSIVTES